MLLFIPLRFSRKANARNLADRRLTLLQTGCGDFNGRVGRNRFIIGRWSLQQCGSGNHRLHRKRMTQERGSRYGAGEPLHIRIAGQFRLDALDHDSLQQSVTFG
jgi:hypothetical protein